MSVNDTRIIEKKMLKSPLWFTLHLQLDGQLSTWQVLTSPVENNILKRQSPEIFC
jgi:hypothetical protein